MGETLVLLTNLSKDETSTAIRLLQGRSYSIIPICWHQPVQLHTDDHVCNGTEEMRIYLQKRKEAGDNNG